MTNRLARIREQLKAEVADIIRRQLRDPRLGFVTITDAEISADLRHARVFFSVLGNEQAVADTTEALTSAAGFIRGEFGHRVTLKFTPEITFHYDATVHRAARIEELFAEIERERTESSGESGS